ncbi:MAG TPA: FAD-binding oxidoreductase [Thermoleophilaceae bacterium]|nr:FAD-binding oxidoreductase [Thermoleophilaceae bacterium]
MSDVLAGASRIDGFSGEQLRPGDAGYDEARVVWNGLFDRHPALIARCISTDDVVAAVNYGRENGLEIAVRSGGHSAAGHSCVDDALVIDLTLMKRIDVDPEAQKCVAQPGLTWGEFDGATQMHGLAVTGGRFSTTGIAGLLLGSGSGWLERKCGLTADNLISAEVVTADGRVLRASKDENPDLFWAIRGGGGNFGVVTEFEIGLHKVGPMIYGGLLGCAPDRATEILTFVREYMKDAPADLGAGFAFVSAPPEPFVPEEMHFAPIFGIIICWTGSKEEGERVVGEIRKVAQPGVDMVGEMPYVALQSMLDGGAAYGTRAYMKAELLSELSDDAIAELESQGGQRPGPMVQLLLEPLGGAIAEMGEDDTALGRRDASWCYHALSLWMDPSQEVADAHVAWAKNLTEAMKPYTRDGVYLNFESDDGDDRVRSSYGPKYERLQALKDKYDPENLFHLNANIKPSS